MSPLFARTHCAGTIFFSARISSLAAPVVVSKYLFQSYARSSVDRSSGTGISGFLIASLDAAYSFIARSTRSTFSSFSAASLSSMTSTSHSSTWTAASSSPGSALGEWALSCSAPIGPSSFAAFPSPSRLLLTKFHHDLFVPIRSRFSCHIGALLLRSSPFIL